jgi:hypothetical protein
MVAKQAAWTDLPELVFQNLTLSALGLTADVTVTEAHPRDWLAIATVRVPDSSAVPPALLLMGRGPTRAEALTEVERELTREARRIAARG